MPDITPQVNFLRRQKAQFQYNFLAKREIFPEQKYLCNSRREQMGESTLVAIYQLCQEGRRGKLSQLNRYIHIQNPKKQCLLYPLLP